MSFPIRSLAAALLSLTVCAGCVVSGHSKAIKTADRMDHLKAALEDLRSSVTATSTSLSLLVAQKDTDAATPFQQFDADVHALASARKRASSRMAGLRAEAEAYFVTWKEQAATINDEDLKESSEERRAELASAVDRVEESMKPVCEKIDTYLATLQDTLKYLSIDLTPQGIAAIESRAKSAAKTSKAVGESVGDVLGTVQKAAPLFAMARASSPSPRKSAAAPAEQSTN